MHVHLPNNIQNQTCILAKKQLYQHLIHKHLQKKKERNDIYFLSKRNFPINLARICLVIIF